MANNEKITDRVREALAHLPKVVEKKMFSGVTFMVNGKMCVSVGSDRIMCRIDPALHDEAVERGNCRTVLMKGREYKGFIYVDEEGIKKKKDFDYWIGLCLDYNKRAKAAPKKKKPLRSGLIALLLLAGIAQTALAQTVVSQATHPPVPYGHNKAAGHYLATRGFKLYYEMYGKGEPLLFIHGNGGAIDNFSNNIPFFSKSYRVIAIDSRAHGNSKDPSDSLTFEMMADDFNALLDSLHLDSCYVIGWSDGGINGLLLAIRHPDKVKKLAITGANLWADTTGLTPFVFNLIKQGHADLKKQPQTPEIKNQLKIVDLDLYQPNITLEQLHQIKCPTLVIGGDHDAIPVQHTVLIAENIPRSYCWIIPNSGHSTPIFKKDQFNPLINDFFKSPYRKIEGGDTFQ